MKFIASAKWKVTRSFPIEMDTASFVSAWYTAVPFVTVAGCAPIIKKSFLLEYLQCSKLNLCEGPPQNRRPWNLGTESMITYQTRSRALHHGRSLMLLSSMLSNKTHRIISLEIVSDNKLKTSLYSQTVEIIGVIDRHGFQNV